MNILGKQDSGGMSQPTLESSAPLMNISDAWDFGRLAREIANWAACVLLFGLPLLFVNGA